MNEGYLPLYRKYRPQKIADIVGQEHIKRALTNAIEMNKIAHAYLFTGPRGTGKTSTARILAKSLNCINGPTLTPCEECESCKSITNTIPIDVIEIDAASNRSVDDAHEILEKVQYAPIHGKYKIYIIDEVHMLTTQAFNALLKTLEEPPKNVIFILATTESHKVLDTIKSRCQKFDFKRITTSDIINHLKDIAKKENINITDGAISLIAKSSAGGMRDSLALLDQVSTMGSKTAISEDDINSLLGKISFDSLFEMTSHIINSDSVSAINSLEQVYNNGNEPIQILTNLLLFFKNMLIIKTCQNSSELTGLLEEQVKKISQLAEQLETHQIILLINKSANYIKELKDTTNQQMWLEVGLIDLSNMAENTKLLELEDRILRLEGKEGIVQQKQKPVINISEPVRISKPTLAKPEPISEPEPETKVMTQPETKIETETKPVIKESPVEVASETTTDFSKYKNLNELWVEILQTLLKDDLGALYQMKEKTILTKFASDGIVIACNTQRFTDNMNVSEKREKLLNAIYSVVGKNDAPLIIRVKTDEEKNLKPAELPKPKLSVVPKDLPPELDEIVETPEDKKPITNATEPVEDDNIEQDISSESADEGNIQETSALSEQANLVKNIFDGKVIE